MAGKYPPPSTLRLGKGILGAREAMAGTGTDGTDSVFVRSEIIFVLSSYGKNTNRPKSGTLRRRRRSSSSSSRRRGGGA